jgi:hypothetical protein
MKILLVSVLLVVLLGINSFGQADGKWSIGVGTSLRNGFTADLYIDRHLGDRWQIGLMPTALFSFNPIAVSTMVVLNLNARFYFSNWQVVRPYTYSYAGYGEEFSRFIDSPDPMKVVKFINASLGVGLRVPLGKKGWSLDGNVGYLGYFGTSVKKKFQTYVISFSVFKRFGKMAKQ